MRLRCEEVDFSSFLLTIGDGTAQVYHDEGEDTNPSRVFSEQH